MKKTLALVLAVIMVVSMLTVLAVSVNAEYGDDEKVEWWFDEGTGTLTIIPYTEAMPDYADKDSTPWKAYNDKIKTVIIDGTKLRTVGKNSFCHTTVETVYVGEGITKINQDAFAYCDNLKTVYLPSTITEIGQGIAWASGTPKAYYAGTAADFTTKVTKVGMYNSFITGTNEAGVVVGGELGVETAVPAAQALLFYPSNDGMENWSDETQILLVPYIMGAPSMSFKDVEWTLKITDGTNTKTMKKIKQSSDYGKIAGNADIIRIQPCTQDADNFFAPEKNKSYKITASCKLADGTEYKASYTGFGIGDNDPITHGGTTVWDTVSTGDTAVIATIVAVVALAAMAVVVKKVRV